MRIFLSLILLINLVGCSPAFAEVGKASWYDFKSCRAEGTSGYFTASGARFDETAMTCALPRRDFGGTYKVTNLKNGKSVVVTQNDFGPGKKPRARGVVIDLSRGAFSKIADLKSGIIAVEVTPL